MIKRVNWSVMLQILTVMFVAATLFYRGGGSATLALYRLEAAENRVDQVEKDFRAKQINDAGFQSMIMTELQSIKNELKNINRRLKNGSQFDD